MGKEGQLLNDNDNNNVREALLKNCPKRGGGDPCPNFLTLLSTMFSLIFWHQYHVIWNFLVIFNTKIIKSIKIIITIITHIIVVIIVTWFCNTRKNVVFDVQKKLYNLPELGGGGGGEVIWAMPERNRFFLWEVFPKPSVKMYSKWHKGSFRPPKACSCNCNHVICKNISVKPGKTRIRSIPLLSKSKPLTKKIGFKIFFPKGSRGSRESRTQIKNTCGWSRHTSP